MEFRTHYNKPALMKWLENLHSRSVLRLHFYWFGLEMFSYTRKTVENKSNKGFFPTQKFIIVSLKKGGNKMSLDFIIMV